MGQKITTSTGPHGTTAIAPPITAHQKAKIVMQIVVSLIVLVVGILILTSPHRIFNHAFDEGTKRWAAGWIGAIIGYWFS